MRDTTRHQYLGLDGLRGLAALAVVFYHARDWFPTYLPGSYLAVDFFFLLSGFVIAHAYDARIANGTLGLWRFALLRIIRLYPLYLLALVMTVWVRLGDMPTDELAARTLAAVFILPNLSREAPLFLVAASWSLFFEIAINLLFVLLHRHLSTAVLLTMAALGLVICVIFSQGHGSLNVGFTWDRILGGLGRVLASFPLGVVIYRHRATLIADRTWTTWPCFVLLTVILALPVVSTIRPVYDVLAVGLMLPAVLILAASAMPSGASVPIMATLGAVSYPIYIIHGAFLRMIDAKFGLEAMMEAAPFWVGLSLIAALFVACLLLDEIYDQPVRRWLLQRLGPSRAARPQVAI